MARHLKLVIFQGVLAGAFGVLAGWSAALFFIKHRYGIAIVGHFTHTYATVSPSFHASTTTGGRKAIADPNPAVATSLFEGHQWQDLEAFLQRWGATDAAAAFQWARKLPPEYKRTAFRAILLGWVSADPDAAFQWAYESFRDLFKERDFYETLASAGRYDLGEQANLAIGGQADTIFFDTWAKHDLPSAINYVNSMIAAGVFYPRAMDQVAAYWAVNDFPSALAWVNTNKPAGTLKPGDTLNDMLWLRTIYGTMAQSMIAAGQVNVVENWANTILPQTPVRDIVCAAIAEDYAESNPEEAIAWMKQAADGPKRYDFASCAILTKTRPDLLAAYYAEATNQAFRENRLTILIPEWAKTDPAAAIAFTANTKALSEENRIRLLAELNAAVNARR